MGLNVCDCECVQSLRLIAVFVCPPSSFMLWHMALQTQASRISRSYLLIIKNNNFVLHAPSPHFIFCCCQSNFYNRQALCCLHLPSSFLARSSKNHTHPHTMPKLTRQRQKGEHMLSLPFTVRKDRINPLSNHNEITSFLLKTQTLQPFLHLIRLIFTIF